MVQTHIFARKFPTLLGEDELAALELLLAASPTAGELVPDTGGVRKLRVAARSKGKRGGARVLYFATDDTMPIFLLTIYGKDEKDDVSPAEKAALHQTAKAILAAYRRRRGSQ
ncbi:MAG: type II toxin-antitoxin system RelE/ParE family toxin [Alphaproteobacteria bacterium]